MSEEGDILTEANMSEDGDILTEATEGICWHKNNFTKSRENGLNECNVPEFLKVTLKRASNRTEHRGLYNSTSSESLNEGSPRSPRKNWKRKENFEGKSMHASMGANYIDMVDFGDGLTQKMRSMSACTGDAVSVSVGLLADSTNCISDYGEGTRQKMEKGSLKDLDGTANFSIEIGEGKEGIYHTLDFGEGTTEKSETGHLKSAVRGNSVSISNDDTEEDPAMDAALRSSSWMTREQLESFVRIALRGSEEEENVRVSKSKDVNFIEAVIAASVAAVASSRVNDDSKLAYAAALEQLVGRMDSKMKRIFIEKAVGKMTNEQMRSFVIEAYDARERGSVMVAIGALTQQQLQQTLVEMTETMDVAEKRVFATESIATLEREALEKIFDHAAKAMTKEEFQVSLARIEEEVEKTEMQRGGRGEGERGEMMEKGSLERQEKDVFLCEAEGKAERKSARMNGARSDGSFQSKATSATSVGKYDDEANTNVAEMRDEETTLMKEMRMVEEKQKMFYQCAEEFKTSCQVFKEETSAFQQQVSLYKEESSSFKKSIAFEAESSGVSSLPYRESEEILRRQLSAESCGRADCLAEREDLEKRIRESKTELAEARMSLAEAKARKVVEIGESTMKKMEQIGKSEIGMRKEAKSIQKMHRELRVEEENFTSTSTEKEKHRGVMMRAAEVDESRETKVEEKSASMSKNQHVREKQASHSEKYQRTSKQMSSKQATTKQAATMQVTTTKQAATMQAETMQATTTKQATTSSSSSISSVSSASSNTIESHKRMEAIAEAGNLATTNMEGTMETVSSEASEHSQIQQQSCEMSSTQLSQEYFSETQKMSKEQIISKEMMSKEQVMNKEQMSNERMMSKEQFMNKEQITSANVKMQEAHQMQSYSNESRMMKADQSPMRDRKVSVKSEIVAEISACSLEDDEDEITSYGNEMTSYGYEMTSCGNEITSRENEIFYGDDTTSKTTGRAMASINHAEAEENQTVFQHSEMSHSEQTFESQSTSREEKTTLKERTLSWEHQNARSIPSRKVGLEADADDGDGICWHHINYKSVEDERQQPEFLRAKLRKTSFGPSDRDRRRKSSGSETSSR